MIPSRTLEEQRCGAGSATNWRRKHSRRTTRNNQPHHHQDGGTTARRHAQNHSRLVQHGLHLGTARHAQPDLDRTGKYRRAAQSLAAAPRLIRRGFHITRGLTGLLVVIIVSVGVASPLPPAVAYPQAAQPQPTRLSRSSLIGMGFLDTQAAPVEASAPAGTTTRPVTERSRQEAAGEHADRDEIRATRPRRPLVAPQLPLSTVVISATDTLSTTQELIATAEVTATAELDPTEPPTQAAEPIPEPVPAAVLIAALSNTCTSTGLVEVPVDAPRPMLHPIAAESFALVRAEVKAQTGIDALAVLGDVLRAPNYQSDKAGVAEYSWHKAGRAIDLNMQGGFRAVPELVRYDGHTYTYHRVFVGNVDITAIFLNHGWTRIGTQGTVSEWWHFEYHPEHVPWAVAMRQVWSLHQLQASYPEIAWKSCPRGPLPRISSTTVPLTPMPSPTAQPTAEPTPIPSSSPTVMSTVEPTPAPTVEPTLVPTDEVTQTPTVEPTPAPTATSVTEHVYAEPTATP